MADATTLPYPMVSAITKLDVISKPSIEVFPLSTTLVKVSDIFSLYINKGPSKNFYTNVLPMNQFLLSIGYVNR